MKHPEARKTRTLDVRPMMARGEEPFVKIITTVASLGPSEDFLLLSPFLPAPLIEKLRSEGFTAKPERRVDGGWQTLFSRG
jgi:hypothetical protein